MSRVLNVVLTHQPPAEIARLAAWWGHVAVPDALLLVHGGPQGDFPAIVAPNKIHVASPRLRTVDNPRERQGYTEVFAAVAEWMKGRDFTHVYFAEFDHLPLVADLGSRLLARLAAEKADMLAHGVQRVDDTGWHHYLYHGNDPEFHRHWERISRRADRRVVLSMLGTGSFWTREAFDAVAAEKEPFPIYLELYLPTLAHHLGFRVRPLTSEEQPYVRNVGDFREKIRDARLAGAWTIHPVKSLDGLRWSGE
jgi:hypothetical protein